MISLDGVRRQVARGTAQVHKQVGVVVDTSFLVLLSRCIKAYPGCVCAENTENKVLFKRCNGVAEELKVIIPECNLLEIKPWVLCICHGQKSVNSLHHLRWLLAFCSCCAPGINMILKNVKERAFREYE